jgi:hypothetical protein
MSPYERDMMSDIDMNDRGIHHKESFLIWLYFRQLENGNPNVRRVWDSTEE